jgi:hypothetical protein
MLTFHGSQEIKDQRIAQVRAHRLADQLVKGHYWEDGKGCAVGCTIHGSDHFAYETELGIPVELAYLEDRIFEGLSNGKAMMWPERFLASIPVGVDLRATHINKRFVLALITDEKRGIMRLIRDDESRKEATEIVEFLKQGISEPSPTMAPDALRRMADRADLAYRAYRAYLAYRADRADLAYRAYLADLADLADLAYRAYRAYLADLADRAYRADLAYLADLADLADLAGSAGSAYLAEILLEVLAASAPITSSDAAALAT